MRYAGLDTDVASRAIKGQLGDPLAGRLTGMAWCVTFVTVGELWQRAAAIAAAGTVMTARRDIT